MLCRFKILLEEVNRSGAAIPGFFADQSTQVLDFMMKTIYFTALWTAHVFHLRF
jgi:hypothetical protein